MESYVAAYVVVWLGVVVFVARMGIRQRQIHRVVARLESRLADAPRGDHSATESAATEFESRTAA